MLDCPRHKVAKQLNCSFLESNTIIVDFIDNIISIQYQNMFIDRSVSGREPGRHKIELFII